MTATDPLLADQLRASLRSGEAPSIAGASVLSITDKLSRFAQQFLRPLAFRLAVRASSA